MFYRKLHEMVTYLLELDAHVIFGDVVELFESYCGCIHNGKRGRRSAVKIAVFGILKRGGKVYTKVVMYTKAETLMALIVSKVERDSVV